MWTKIIWLPVVWMVLTSAPALAAPERPLPDFTVVTADGQARASGVLTSEPRWLLVYVRPESGPCNRLLRLLKDWQSAALTTRTVLVVGGTVEDARTYVERRLPKELQGFIAWYADPDESAWNALELRGTPVMLGVEDGQIQWRLAGVLSRPESLESVVRTWVEKP
jgi:hypothetical protein